MTTWIFELLIEEERLHAREILTRSVFINDRKVFICKVLHTTIARRSSLITRKTELELIRISGEVRLKKKNPVTVNSTPLDQIPI